MLNTLNEAIKTLHFILKPIEPDGIIFKLNEQQIIYLKDEKIVIENIEIDHKLKLNDYNEIELINKEKEIVVSINGRKMKFEKDFDKIYVERQLQIGDLSNGFTGGIRNIIINTK